ncbi:restriction endonuclease subunit S [Gaetbulibacter jejuensis]|uniref:restriction endonuclease subunit S n=1 Tax=Gaetbulibacter jejuensis TaxID=584607 RepID=UPI00300A92AD
MPKNWKTYKLEEISTDVSYGYTESASLEEIGPKFLRITDIQNDYIDWHTVPYCKISEKDLIKNKLEIGDIVIARTGNSTGATICVKDNINAVFASYLIRFRINQEIAYPFYIDYILRSVYWKNYVNAIKGGSAQPGANAKQFGDFDLNLPPLPEQKAIANILSAIDDKIENNLAINKTLEDMAMALYKHWFVDFGPFQDGEFIDSELGPIPKGWEVRKVKDIFNITIGRTPPRKQPQWFSKDNGVKWISIKDLGNSGSYIFETSEFLTEDAVRKFRVPIIASNTVILSFKLTVGRVAIVTENMLSNEAIAHFNEKEKAYLSTEYLYLYLKNFDFNSLGSTSSIATAVNSQTIKNIDCLIPKEEHKIEFNKQVQPNFEQIKNNQIEIQTLSALRDTLLPKLISGEVRLKEFKEQIESVIVSKERTTQKKTSLRT